MEATGILENPLELLVRCGVEAHSDRARVEKEARNEKKV